MKSFVVTLENFSGQCKKTTVLANSLDDAMAMAQRGGWFAVDAVLAS